MASPAVLVGAEPMPAMICSMHFFLDDPVAYSQDMKIALALMAALCTPGVLAAQNSAPASLLVLSKRDHTLAIVDPLSLQVVSKVPVGNDPHEVIASADGSTAYVSNYGFGAYHTLAVVDLIGRTSPAVH